MSKYYFETREFGVSDQGIHLLRSRYNYKTIDFNQVAKITIERGKELNNWIAILVLGIALTSFALYYAVGMFNFLTYGISGRVSIQEILVPVIPFLMGAYCLYSSTRNGIVMRVRTIEDTHERFPLKELDQRQELTPFQQLLKEKASTKVTENL
ncbi:hypothetical protein KK062_02360 [Fulvivirgaceae bacterium PWU5]|uniref:Uncharacterized protein n=1 Tax=Dawidia cretensis TaxID=2782350 RepID=A0AAP2DWM7_9BACT|nr:hypothetical protein [Dawidia cretensis]MBT1707044.1 hypothetical protein [Dawidia cretensis]